MPIYRYYCAECSEEQESVIPMTMRDNPRLHSCGNPMQRLPTLPAPAQFPITGRDKVLKVLNKQDGFDLPTRPEDRPRMEKAMVRGLDPEKPTIGRGFG